MIAQAIVRTQSLLLTAALLLAGGCKDTQGAGSGPPTPQEAGGGFVGGPADGQKTNEPKTDGPTPPVGTATAGDTAPPADSAGEVQPPDSTEKFVECTTRTSICTREYRPVCGKLTDGTVRTFGNKCVACSDTNVLGYTAGACEQEQPPPM